ncbi:MAG: hypothetical protein ACRESJ_27030 [Pseudomonas sp.]|uniref:hypothetical protein n=1 Tax=Pseudomonas sp. TaxID=306 RepID=UPI003D6EEF0F
MNRCIPGLSLMLLIGIFDSQVQAQDMPLVVAQNLPNNNPYNSPIRRANPNSMQGTQPSIPAIRGPNTVPVPRPPTLDNGGIGNRYPQSPGAPASPPKFIPNPPVRDSGSSNR